MDVPHSPEVGEQLPVQVLLRLKPPSGGQRETIVVHAGPRTLKVCNPVQTTSANGESILVSKRLEYAFDWVLPESSSQLDTFRKSCPSMLRHFYGGGNALLFAYGPSNSGKTHTVLGDDKQPGLLPNILKSVFASIEIANARENAPAKPSIDGTVYPLLPNMEYNVWISYLECYNERIYDLLRKRDATTKGEAPAALDIKYTKSHVPIVPSNEPMVTSFSQAVQWMHLGQNNRQSGATQINKNSSRSHAIFTIKLTQTPIGATKEDIQADPSIVRYSKFSIVDLAGSERSGKSLASGDRLREASNINNSLLTLKRCMKALQQNQMNANINLASSSASSAHPNGLDSAQKPLPSSRRTSTDKGLGSALNASGTAAPKALEVVPFRDSTLTKLLREYLQGEGKCSVIVNINPAPLDYDETIQALDFGTITKAVKTTTCKKKMVARSASPPQPIPFSLTQATAAIRAETRQAPSRTASKASMTLDRLNSSTNLNKSLNQSVNALNQSLNNSQNLANGEFSTALNRSTAKEVEASSPSKTTLNRPRIAHSSANSPVGSSSRRVSEINNTNAAVIPLAPVQTVPSASMSGIARQLFKFDGLESSVSQYEENAKEDVFEEEEEDEEIMAFDQMELVEEVNKLRTALVDAENRVVEVEMEVRAELAQEVADRMLAMDAFYRKQSDDRLRNMQEKYDKMLEHYEQTFKEGQKIDLEEVDAAADDRMMDLDDSMSNKNSNDQGEEQSFDEKETDVSTATQIEEEEKSASFDLLCQKEAQLEDVRVQLTLTKADLDDTNARLAALHESSHKQLLKAQNAHSEEVAVLKMRIEQLTKELESAKRELAEKISMLAKNEKELLIASSMDIEVAEEAEIANASKNRMGSDAIEVEAPSTTASAVEKKKGRPKKSSATAAVAPIVEEEEEKIVENEIDAESDADEPVATRSTSTASKKSAATKKRKEKTETTTAATAKRAKKVAKSHEDATPSSSLVSDPFEFPDSDAEYTKMLESEDDSSVAAKKKKTTSKRSSARAATSRAKKSSVTPIVVDSDEEKEEDVVEEPQPVARKTRRAAGNVSASVTATSAQDSDDESEDEKKKDIDEDGDDKKADKDDQDFQVDEDDEAFAADSESQDDASPVKKRGVAAKRTTRKATSTATNTAAKGTKRTLKRSVAVKKGRPTKAVETIEIDDDAAADTAETTEISPEAEVETEPEPEVVKKSTLAATKKRTSKKSAAEEDDEDFEDAENAENTENVVKTSATPLTKRLRSRRPVEVIMSPVAEEIPLKKTTNQSMAAGRRRGAAAAPLYLSNLAWKGGK